MYKKNYKRQSGFTLIELMIVVVLVAVLATFALPAYQGQIQKARRVDAMDLLTECAAAQARNYTTASPPTYLNAAELVNDGLCNSLVSKEGFYQIDLVQSQNCTNANNTTWCFLMRAIPVAGEAQVGDANCAVWTIDQSNNRTAASSGGGDTTDQCWRT